MIKKRFKHAGCSRYAGLANNIASTVMILPQQLADNYINIWLRQFERDIYFRRKECMLVALLAAMVKRVMNKTQLLWISDILKRLHSYLLSLRQEVQC